MRLRRLPLTVVVLVGLSLIAGVACDGGDGGAGGRTSTPEGTATPEGSPTPTPEGTATPEGSPTADASPEATEPSATTPPPSRTVTPPAGVRLAVVPENYYEFLVRLGAQQSYRTCSYDESSGLVDCTRLGLGQFQLDPPTEGSGVHCGAAEREGEVLAIECTTQDPVSATLYEVLE